VENPPRKVSRSNGIHSDVSLLDLCGDARSNDLCSSLGGPVSSDIQERIVGTTRNAGDVDHRPAAIALFCCFGEKVKERDGDKVWPCAVDEELILPLLGRRGPQCGLDLVDGVEVAGFGLGTGDASLHNVGRRQPSEGRVGWYIVDEEVKVRLGSLDCLDEVLDAVF
jgi:hypothetical protein